MTTQTSFSEKKSANRRFFNTQFFKFQLKTGWPLLVVFIFVFILSMAVPSVSYITDTLSGYYDGHFIVKSYEYVRDKAVEFLYMMGTWNVIISMFGGFLCGLTTMRFTNNKVAVNFYHSLPMRRESLFLTSTLQSFLYYVIAFAAGLLLVFATFTLRLGSMAGYFLRPILLTFEYGVLFFLLVYAMTLFAASLTGTGFMRFVGAAYIIFLPLAMFLLFVVTVGSCGIYYSILDIDYYLSSKFCILLCAPLRFINLVGNSDTGDIIFRGAICKDIVIVLVTALVMYGLAFLLYCLRHSESASQPIIWKPARFVFKYASVFMGGTLFALMFYGMFESIPWMIFGIIIGSVIVFMLVNGILNKSARAIFKGLKGFIVYMAVMAVITMVFYCDVFGMFSSIPDGSLVNKVEIDLDYTIEAEYSGDFASKVTNLIKKTYERESNNIYYTDNENPEKPLVEIYSDVNGDEDKIVVSVGETYSGYQYNSMALEAVFHTKFGVPYAIRIHPNCEDVYELAQFLYDTGKAEAEIPTANQVESGYIEVYLNEYSVNKDTYFEESSTIEDMLKYVEMLSDPTGEKGESPIVGQMVIHTNNAYDSVFDSIYSYVGNYNRYFITAKDIDVLNEVAVNLDKEFTSEDDVIDFFIKQNSVSGLYIVDNEKNERIHITDEVTIREMMKSMYSFNGYYDSPVLCSKEHRFNIFIQTKQYNEYWEDTNYYECLSFRKGTVPEMVTELFG